MTVVMGVNAGRAAFHDPAACVVDGRGSVLAFVEEERLTRRRHAAGVMMPRRSVARCLDLAGLTIGDVDVVAVGWDEPRLARAAGRSWDRAASEEFLRGLGFDGPVLPRLEVVPHHHAHALSAFHASGHDRAAVLVVDGNGEHESATIFHARREGGLIWVRSWPRVVSVGHLYEAVSRWLGLGKHGAGKVMGLASYGHDHIPPEPGWLTVRGEELVSCLGGDATLGYDELKHLWAARIEDFTCAGRPTTGPAGLAGDRVAVRVAAAVQHTTDTVVGWLADQARRLTGETQLCIAGGVGLNCTTNGHLPGPVFVPPVPHDAGVALGAAWAIAPPRTPGVLTPHHGGPAGELPSGPDPVQMRDADPGAVAALLLRGHVVGVCRGRAEIGPRALGHRSLLASPLAAVTRDRLNRLKHREPWRPFGPVGTDPGPWWEPVGDLDRYMIGATRMTPRGRAELPAVCHVDATTRPQRLHPGQDTFLQAVLDQAHRGGHPPVLINTSFNGPGEPIVDTAAQAFDCARRLGIDALVTDTTLLTLTGRRRAPRQ